MIRQSWGIRFGSWKQSSGARAAKPRLEELEDRSTPTVGLGGDFNSIQYADGSLTRLAWDGNDLVYRVKTGPGTDDWSRETVLTDQFDGQSPGPIRSLGEQLIYDAAGNAHVLRLENGFFGDSYTLQNYQRSAAGAWSTAESVVTPGTGVGYRESRLASAVGPGNSFHVAFVSNLNGALQLIYGSNAGGTWSFQPVAPSDYLYDQYGQIYAAQRYLSLAVDAQGTAHIAYTPTRFVENFGRVYSALWYATNQGGTWHTQGVYEPPDGTGDAGIGSSIAIGPNGEIGIASVLVDRVATGSPNAAWLMYHLRQPNGSFASERVARKPDGYYDSDGPKGTGFAPMLDYDATGRPLIAFSDFATVHRPHAQEYTGQIRLAARLPAGWGFATLFVQRGPYNNGVFFPTFALGNGEIAVTAGVNSGDTLGASLTTFVVPLVDSMFVIGEPPDPDPPQPSAPPAAPPLVTAVLKTVRKGKTAVLYIEVTRNGSRQLLRCPFQWGRFKGIRMQLIDSNGDGVVDAIRVTSRPRQGRAKVIRQTLPI